MKEKEVLSNSFVNLKEFRVIKYQDVIQNILHFLGCSKSEINLPGKTILNCKKVKVEKINKDTFDQILGYVFEGPKEGNFHSYCKVTHLT